MISFKVLNRFSGAVQFTAKIDCGKGEAESVKLWLAVRWAHETGADLTGRFEDGSHVIRAGCRTKTLDDYREHIGTEYPDTDKARETLAILAFLESRLNDTAPAAAQSEAA